jgi:hypothetical protein
MKRVLFIVGTCLLLASCVNSKKLMENTKIDRVCFGKRGGFTNIPMEYVLFEKGQLYKQQNDSLVRIQRVSRKRLAEIDSLFLSSNFRELKVNHPGNITYFIKVISRDYENEVKWSDSSGQEVLTHLYNALLAIIKEKNKQ